MALIAPAGTRISGKALARPKRGEKEYLRDKTVCVRTQPGGSQSPNRTQ